MAKRSHLNEKWYVVGSPWGNGTHIVAGHNDPHIGLFVCDCESWSYDEYIEAYGDKWDVATSQEIASRIATDHNECLKLRQELARARTRLEEQKTPQQHIEELFA